ncbi:MAG: M23 family metallopeptidase [Candidatus Kerfeldbacteria bacterium]|nr:M23 family metallopeptidase [Candidatus Kerfeldbacteria bacterium]
MSPKSILFFLIFLATGVILISKFTFETPLVNGPITVGNTYPANTNVNTAAANANTTVTPPAQPSVVLPLADFYSRITKKPFGIYITPQQSPVQPERFTGYHTGADAEATPAEAAVDVPVLAVAAGTIVFAGHVNGYGGVMVIRHTVNKETFTALYGHVRIASFTKGKGETVKAGEHLALLGTGGSSETDGERKHLHLGFVKGTTVNYKGYVSTRSALSAWLDPVAWLKTQGV